MKKNIEKEYKVLVTKNQFETLCSYYNNLKFIKQINTYYDTYEDDIQKMHGAMRIREKEDKYIFTLKLHSGDDLMEHECIVPYKNLHVFDLSKITQLLNSYKIYGPFKEIAVCTTYRAVVTNEDAELCFDKNLYHNITDYEIEYEYKREHDGIKAFNKILEPIEITYQENCLSKIRRTMDALKK